MALFVKPVGQMLKSLRMKILSLINKSILTSLNFLN